MIMARGKGEAQARVDMHPKVPGNLISCQTDSPAAGHLWLGRTFQPCFQPHELRPVI